MASRLNMESTRPKQRISEANHTVVPETARPRSKRFTKCIARPMYVPIAVLYQSLLSCPHILHIPLPPQLLVTKGKELRKPHKMEQLTTTIVIYIVLSMIHYAPDVRHAAIYFSRLISQSLVRTKSGTEVLDNDELEGLYEMSDEPGDDKIGDDLFRNSLSETVWVRTMFSRHPTSLTYFFCRCTAPRKPSGLMAL